jgi:glutathione synthase/RimK-type ligase-like ATP-grasp enzyme
MPDVLLATGVDHPDLWEDELVLVEALADRGLSAGPGVWSDSSVDWAAARIVLVRSAFDYIRDREGFCAWADRVEAATPLHNPARVLRWNSHKSYLRELEAAGVPIVPTAWVDAGSRTDLAGLLAERSWRDAVVKPAVDNGARGALRVHAGDPEKGQSHLDRLLAERDVMIQPFVAATETSGERAMIHIDGRFSHAIRKDQMLAGRTFSLARTPPIVPESQELALAAQVLSLIPESPLLYARVDAVMDGGVARLMELEVIEPVLFFSKAPGSADRMAAAISARL